MLCGVPGGAGGHAILYIARPGCSLSLFSLEAPSIVHFLEHASLSEDDGPVPISSESSAAAPPRPGPPRPATPRPATPPRPVVAQLPGAFGWRAPVNNSNRVSAHWSTFGTSWVLGRRICARQTGEYVDDDKLPIKWTFDLCYHLMAVDRCNKIRPRLDLSPAFPGIFGSRIYRSVARGQQLTAPENKIWGSINDSC